MIAGYENVLVVGCGTCVTVCFAGGEKEVGILAAALRMKAMTEGNDLNIKEATVERQCDREFFNELVKDAGSCDAILSMGCGAGVQLLAEVYDAKPVYPVLNTKFIGTTDEQGIWSEKCSACGDCILDKTSGICPITRCAKSLLNGPCGGSQDGKCEINPDTECAWQLIYDKLKASNRLEFLERIQPARDWSSSAHGGARKVVREDLVIEPEAGR